MSACVTGCRVVEAEEEVVPLRLARIDAARGIGERIEYEVPLDPTGMRPITCQHSRGPWKAAQQGQYTYHTSYLVCCYIVVLL